MPRLKRKRTLTALAAGAILSVCGRSDAAPLSKRMEEMEFATSTQRMGVRFTEKIREVFRHRWIRRKPRLP